MARYYLGVDGGQSSTTAIIGDESGQVLGRGQAGPCNHVTGAEAEMKFRVVVGSCVAEACRQAYLDPETIIFSAACLGFSGGPEDKDAYTRQLIRSEKYKITHDAEIALSGALAGSPGIIVISGTGSVAFGRNAAGTTARAGGWGYIYGDEGGAFDLVRRALRASLQGEEGWGPVTTLHRLLLEQTSTSNCNELLHRLYTPEYQRSRIAQLAPVVTKASEDGDRVATQVIYEAASKLAWYVEGVHRMLFAGELVQVATVGGTFQSKPLMHALQEQLLDAVGCETVKPKFSPAEGALLEAMRLDSDTDSQTN
jgi:N-acetylglucosamine kinase-like BadF-type ATPase